MGRTEVTKVTKLVLAVLVLLLARAGAAEGPAASAQELWRQLASVGLDPARVYRIRGVSLDREDLHLSFEDGVIAFTQAVNGRITGAFFEGEGEVLIMPPDRVERSSMHLFTGSAVLEEKFSSAYLRFSDDTFAELQPALRPAEDGAQFVAAWDAQARTLAESDSLRLLASFLNVGGDPRDRMLRLRLRGVTRGNFDVVLDYRAREQLSAGQMNFADGAVFFDVWTAFPVRSVRRAEAQAASDVRISRYRLRTQIVPPRELNASAELTLEVRDPGQRVLFFELSRFLKLSEVSADGRPLEFLQNPALEGTALARRGNDVVAVVFPEPLTAGRSVPLKFVYGGPVLSEAGGGLMYVGARGTWFPNRGPAMAEFDMEFRYPAGWTLLATGQRVSLENSGEEQVARWVSERPMPVAGFNLGQYDSASAKSGNVVVESYAARSMETNFPAPAPKVLMVPGVRPRTMQRLLVMPERPTPARQAEAVAANSARALDFLARKLGPFPYSSLALTQMPGPLSHGWPGLVFLSSYAFLSPQEMAEARLSRSDTLFFGLVTQPHEVAHQWWGSLLVWNSYRDQWLVEALANYCALAFLEAERPAEFREILAEYRTRLAKKNEGGRRAADAGPVSLGLRLYSSKFPDGYDAVGYGRGTWLVHMLRHMLLDGAKASRRPGVEEPFFQVLRRMVERFQGKAISTRDLQQAFEEALPESLYFEKRKSLEWFFDGWVNGTAFPELQLADVKFTRKAGALTATGRILQKDAPDDLVTSVPLYAAGKGKPVLLGRVFADGESTWFRFTVPAGATKLLLDPLETVLTRP